MRQSCSKRFSGSPQPQKPMLEEVWNPRHVLNHDIKGLSKGRTMQAAVMSLPTTYPLSQKRDLTMTLAARLAFKRWQLRLRPPSSAQSASISQVLLTL